MSDFLRYTREEREAREAELLAPAATLASKSRGREIEEPEDPYRTCFERDRDRITHAKAFRRLKHKTQVFINPDGDHYVTRLTHTLQVAQVGRAIARALGLNESLTEAMCLAHDIGHSPFGHTGEDALTPFVEKTSPYGEWLHSVQSLRILKKLEPLNLTYEVLDGIRAHSWKIDPPPETPEGWVLRYADRIAYLAHDASDAMRAGVLRLDDVPQEVRDAFGLTATEWIGTMVESVIEGSLEAGRVTMQPELLDAMHTLRGFMFENVYLRADAQLQRKRALVVIGHLVEYFTEHTDEIPKGYALPDDDPLQQAIDHVAGMTDRYAMTTHDRLFRPEGLY